MALSACRASSEIIETDGKRKLITCKMICDHGIAKVVCFGLLWSIKRDKTTYHKTDHVLYAHAGKHGPNAKIPMGGCFAAPLKELVQMCRLYYTGPATVWQSAVLQCLYCLCLDRWCPCSGWGGWEEGHPWLDGKMRNESSSLWHRHALLSLP